MYSNISRMVLSYHSRTGVAAVRFSRPPHSQSASDDLGHCTVKFEYEANKSKTEYDLGIPIPREFWQ